MLEGSRSGHTSRTSLCIRIPTPHTMRKRAGLETDRTWLCSLQQAASLSFLPLRPPLMRGNKVSERVTYCVWMAKRRPSDLTPSLSAAGDRSWLQNPSYPLLPNSTSAATSSSSSSESESYHSPTHLGKRSRQRRETREKKRRHKQCVSLVIPQLVPRPFSPRLIQEGSGNQTKLPQASDAACYNAWSTVTV